MNAGWDVVAGPRHELGEEPVWDAPRNRLLWVDVPRGQAWSAGLTADGIGRAELLFEDAGPISAVRIATDGTLVYAAGLRVHRVDPDGTRHVIGAIPGDESRWQVNGLVVLPSGTVIAGTLSRDRSEAGALWGIDPRGRCSVLVPDVLAANGLATGVDAGTVWHIDTFARTLTRYDLSDGELAGGGLVVSRFEDMPGKPDGLCVDPTGDLWVAMWDGGCVLRLSPAGDVLDRLSVPVARPTCPTIVGEANPLIVVTTARGSEQSALEGRVLVRNLSDRPTGATRKVISVNGGRIKRRKQPGTKTQHCNSF